MPRLYFKYGTMGSSKSAEALMTKFNYEQKGFKVLLLKPSIDNRDDVLEKTFVASRIGLKSEAFAFSPEQNLVKLFLDFKKQENYKVIIVDEAQFCKANQIEQLKELSNLVPVLCFGLKTNFKSFLFEGSKRLLEIADSIQEIKNICSCGNKAIINARFIKDEITFDGTEVLIGGDEQYRAICYNCWQKLIKKQKINLIKSKTTKD